MQNIIIFFSLLMTALAAKLPTMTESTSVAHPLFNRNTEGTNCTSELYEPTLNYTMCSVGDYVDMGSTHCGIGDAANVNDCTVMLDAMHDYANATGGGGFYGMSNTSIHTVAWVGNCRFTVEPSTSDAGWHVLLGVYDMTGILRNALTNYQYNCNGNMVVAGEGSMDCTYDGVSQSFNWWIEGPNTEDAQCGVGDAQP